MAAVALLPLASLAMSDEIGTLAVGAMQDLHDHDVTRLGWGYSDSHTPRKNSRPTPLKHLPLFKEAEFGAFVWFRCTRRSARGSMTEKKLSISQK